MMKKINKLGVENSLYNNIRKKAEMNKKSGAKPKAPTKAMLMMKIVGTVTRLNQSLHTSVLSVSGLVFTMKLIGYGKTKTATDMMRLRKFALTVKVILN